ncbi:MAG: hypothetical protein KTR30_28525 [Saprospiraceae bacterium]|nr:hypothetical protein [Saprospiraceae bacterium]
MMSSKSISPIVLAFLSFAQVFGQVKYTLKMADSLYAKQAYPTSAIAYASIIDAGQSEVDILYKAAVANAQIQQAEQAVAYLKQAMGKGYDDAYLSETRFDFNFYPILHTIAWKDFYAKATGHLDEQAARIQHPTYRAELLDLWRTDQLYRRMIFGRFGGRPSNELAVATEAVDRFNAKRMEQIIEEIGWPDAEKVGRDGAHAAWYIVQHAVFNPILMRKSLALMEKALEQGLIDGVDYAYLYDRFQAVSYLGPQLYGIVRRVDIKDEYLVNERRKAIGFTASLEEYLAGYTVRTKSQYKARQDSLAQAYQENILLGAAQLQAGDYQKASRFYGKAMRCYGFIQTQDIYECARAYSLLNTRRSRFSAIQKIRSLAARGFQDVEKIKSDTAFKNLLEEKNFKEICQFMAAQ